MKFYPHGGTTNFSSFLQTASLAISASHLENPNRPILSSSLALTAAPMYTGPQGPSGSNQAVTGPQGPSGSAGPTGPRGYGSYTGSATVVTCCEPGYSFCIGVDLYTYDSNCQPVVSCLDIVTCGGTYSSCA